MSGKRKRGRPSIIDPCDQYVHAERELHGDDPPVIAVPNEAKCIRAVSAPAISRLNKADVVVPSQLLQTLKSHSTTDALCHPLSSCVRSIATSSLVPSEESLRLSSKLWDLDNSQYLLARKNTRVAMDPGTRWAQTQHMTRSAACADLEERARVSEFQAFVECTIYCMSITEQQYPFFSFFIVG